MSIISRTILKGWFSKGKKPTQQQFYDWIDSFYHRNEDTIQAASIEGLQALLDEKVTDAPLTSGPFARQGGTWVLFDTSNLNINDPATESLDGFGDNQQHINRETVSTIFAIRDAIRQVAGAAATFEEDPKPQQINSVETRFTFLEAIASTNPDIIEIDALNDQITIKKAGIYQYVTFLNVSNASASQDYALTLRTKDASDDEILTERTLIIPAAGYSGTSSFTFEVQQADLPLTVDFYLQGNAPSTQLVLQELQSTILTGSQVNSSGGLGIVGYETNVAIRAITGYASGNDALNLLTGAWYKFDPAEIATDDDDIYLTPNDILEPAPGRWVKKEVFAKDTINNNINKDVNSNNEVLKSGFNYSHDSADGAFTNLLPVAGGSSRLQIYFDSSADNDITINGNATNIEGAATWIAGSAQDKHLYEFVYNVNDDEWKVRQLDREEGAVGNLAPLVIPFTNNIPFTNGISIMEKAMDSNLLLSPNETGAIAGYGATLRLISDGVSLLSFSEEFKKLSTSDDYSLVLNEVHLITFYYDGVAYYYSISRVGTGEVPPTTPPSLVSATVENLAPNKVILTYNKALDETSIPLVADYIFPGKTTTVIAISGAVVQVTVSVAWTNTDTITMEYIPGSSPVKDLFGNLAAALPAGTEVTNNITALPAGYVEWLTTFDPNTYIWNNGITRVALTATGNNQNLLRATTKLNNGEYVQFKAPLDLGNNQFGIVLASTIITTSGSANYGLFNASGNIYQSVSTIIEAIVPGNYYRIHYNGGLIEYYKSSDGVSFTLMTTAANIPSGDYYIYAFCSERESLEEITSDAAIGSSVVNPTQKLLFYTNPETMPTTLSGWTKQGIVNVADDGGVDKIYFETDATSVATIRYAPITNGVYSVGDQITLNVNGVNITSGKLFVVIGSIGQSGGVKHELVNGNNSFNVDTTSLNNSFVWLAADTLANGGGIGFIGEFRINRQ